MEEQLPDHPLHSHRDQLPPMEEEMLRRILEGEQHANSFPHPSHPMVALRASEYNLLIINSILMMGNIVGWLMLFNYYTKITHLP